MKTLISNVKNFNFKEPFSIQIVESNLLPLVNLNVNEENFKHFWIISKKAQTKLKLWNDNTCLRYRWQLHLLGTLKGLVAFTLLWNARWEWSQFIFMSTTTNNVISRHNSTFLLLDKQRAKRTIESSKHVLMYTRTLNT